MFFQMLCLKFLPLYLWNWGCTSQNYLIPTPIIWAIFVHGFFATLFQELWNFRIYFIVQTLVEEEDGIVKPHSQADTSQVGSFFRVQITAGRSLRSFIENTFFIKVNFEACKTLDYFSKSHQKKFHTFSTFLTIKALRKNSYRDSIPLPSL